jgi:hypothetical protein
MYPILYVLYLRPLCTPRIIIVTDRATTGILALISIGLSDGPGNLTINVVTV